MRIWRQTAAVNADNARKGVLTARDDITAPLPSRASKTTRHLTLARFLVVRAKVREFNVISSLICDS